MLGQLDSLCDGLGIENRLIGHVFLLDTDARVRWRACGVASLSELNTLKNGLRLLL